MDKIWRIRATITSPKYPETLRSTEAMASAAKSATASQMTVRVGSGREASPSLATIVSVASRIRNGETNPKPATSVETATTAI